MINNEKKIKIDFVGIGAPKCGTTWLGKCLEEHPMIDFAKSKETNFFLTDDAVCSDAAHDRSCSGYDEFHKEFIHEQDQIKGEYSIYYLYDPNSPELIKDFSPDAKIIVCLRNQADLLNSAFWFDKASNISDKMVDSLEKAVKGNYKYSMFDLRIGCYYEYLKKYYEIFDSENILVVIFDDIKNKPEELVRQLYDFLGVDNSFKPSCLNARVNHAKAERFRWLSKFTFYVMAVLRKLKLNFLVYKFMHGDSLILKLYNKINKKNFKYPQLSQDFRQEINNMYLEDNLLLENLINRDLSKWK